MHSKSEDTIWSLSNPVLWGLVATASVFILAAIMSLYPVCNVEPNNGLVCSQTKWMYFLNAPPNEIGDTLSGFAGALAFVWLIVTVLLQAKELRAQRQELSLTRKEFKQISQAQEQQVSFMEAQTEILTEQMVATTASRRGKVADQKFRSLQAAILKMFSSGVTVATGKDSVLHFSLTDCCPKKISAGAQIRNLEPEILLETVVNACTHFNEIAATNEVDRVPFELLDVRERLVELGNWVDLSDEITKQKFADLNIGHIVASLKFDLGRPQ